MNTRHLGPSPEDGLCSLHPAEFALALNDEMHIDMFLQICDGSSMTTESALHQWNTWVGVDHTDHALVPISFPASWTKTRGRAAASSCLADEGVGIRTPRNPTLGIYMI